MISITGRGNERRSGARSTGYSQRLGAFTQALGEDRLDASALMIPMVKFLPASDPRIISTVDRIQRELSRNGLIYRYQEDTEDGLCSPEGTFMTCSFWLVNNLALQAAGRGAQPFRAPLCLRQ